MRLGLMDIIAKWNLKPRGLVRGAGVMKNTSFVEGHNGDVFIIGASATLD